MDSGRHQVEGMLQSLAQLAGAELDLSGAYPGWKPDADSEIMHIFRDMYEGIGGHKPNIMVIHSGLECGLFKTLSNHGYGLFRSNHQVPTFTG